MCGICGIFDLDGRQVPERSLLERMIAPQRHRGPDGFGFFRGPGIAMAHARLSIIDLSGGWQPLANEDGTVWITYNGELYNYPDLRKRLLDAGHRFATASDTEVLVHLFEERGMPSMLEELNGQYAFALWDGRTGAMYLVRDPVGIHPLHYRTAANRLYFASEAKGLLEVPGAGNGLNPRALDQVFTFWGPLSGQTLFDSILEVPPGHYLKAQGATTTLRRYWDPPFGEEEDDDRSLGEWAEELLHVLEDATRIRLLADVPVGAYLSGGLDSSVVTSLVHRRKGKNLKTFSIRFEDKSFDEGDYQALLNRSLRTDNSSLNVAGRDIAQRFEQVIWQTEKPVLRTAPTPLFLLSEHVNRSGYKTVLTGEGSDEFLGGYDIFKEALIRHFWLRNPGSATRASLFRRLYPYLSNFASRPVDYLREYFRLPHPGWDELFSSHWVRWMTTGRIKRFYTDEFRSSLGGYDAVEEIQDAMRERIRGLSVLHRAQYIEVQTLLPNYLLSSQGDRMSMGHSVEVRFPFLDPRVIALSCRIPPHYKVLGLNEKAVLKRAMRGRLPDEIVNRHKRPYMAPDVPSFLAAEGMLHPVVEHHLAEERVRSAGVFKATMVESLKRKCAQGRAIGFGDSMALVGILSTQIWLDTFASGRREAPSIGEGAVRRDHLMSGGRNGRN